ncbi:helix-turn-helix domain-containing protein [Actinomadura madurae]|uniref:helix-turn-helix domain-containing protein n=1 Tax=Actinomadura madurae TaxID=1993 RepID=UPI0020D21AD6|nr:helix-turn-helix domain-containing protein [Actinomadura madurae]MCQ0020910.1 helix-turn-helix domain-containing protein [Actinomadura madurae]
MRDLILETETPATAGDDAGGLAGRGLTLIQSLQRGLRLVEAVVEQGPMTARTLSKATGLGMPTTYHLLRTLVYEGYLERRAAASMRWAPSSTPPRNSNGRPAPCVCCGRRPRSCGT